MSHATINVSTGPVQMAPQVLAALAAHPISHRSNTFRYLYNNTTAYLCNQFGVRRCYLLTGSGTAANEAMLWQIKLQGSKGLILSNGEFGERLVHQAARCGLNFLTIRLAWGQPFNLREIEKELKQNKLDWLLFCHCETSTGVVNDLNGLIRISNNNNCLCYVDCMSTVGTYSFDLSKVAMATASSGKGLSSIPGIAIVFSNLEPLSSSIIPGYLDLGKYDENQGIPYTLSSNLVHALNVAIKLKFQQQQFELVDHYSQSCFSLLNEKGVLPFNNSCSKVFTIALPNAIKSNVINKMRNEQLVFSCDSQYLKKKGWCQVALFGFYLPKELDCFIKALEKSFQV